MTTETRTIDRDALAVNNLALAKDYVGKYPWRGLDPEEVLDACNMGLFRAAREYDPSRGSFSTFAFWKMTGEVSETAKVTAYPMKIRVKAADRVGRRDDSPAVFAARAAIAAAHAKVDHGVPNLPAYDERDGTDPVAAAIDLEERLRDAERLCKVMSMLDRLPERERRILVMRFGLDGSDPATYVAIGAKLGISHQRVRELANQAIGRIRVQMGVWQ